MVGLVNIGNEMTNINILEDGMPVLTRDLSVGVAEVPGGHAAGTGAVGRRRRTRSCRDSSANEALDPFLESRGEEMAVGIERAAAFLQSASRSAGSLTRIFTVGGGARIPGLNKVLADRLRIPVEPGNPLARLNVADTAFDSLSMDEVGAAPDASHRTRPEERGVMPPRRITAR